MSTAVDSKRHRGCSIRSQRRSDNDDQNATQGRRNHYENHNEALQVRTALKAGGTDTSTTRRCRFARRSRPAGGIPNHNETLQRAADRPAVSMRRELLTTSRKEDRLELLVVRAGLRAGRRARGRVRG